MKSTLHEWFDSETLLAPVAGHPTILDLARCVASAAGVDVPFLPDGLRPLRDQLHRSRSVVFVLADGLGLNLQHLFPKGGFLTRHLVGELRSVFPSTTATALSSLYSLEWPSRTGVTGWHTHLPEAGKTATVLPFVDRVSGVHLTDLGLNAADVFLCESAFPAYQRRVVSVLPEEISTGVYADWFRGGTRMDGYKDLTDGFARAAVLAGEGSLETVVSLYVPNIDKAEHDHGVECEQAASLIVVLDGLLERLRRDLPDDVRIVLTADHGLVTIPKTRQLLFPHDHRLMRHLATYPSGEATTPVFHVLPGHEALFEQEFYDSFGSAFVLIEPAYAAELGLFGPEPLHPVMAQRLGTFIGVAGEAVALIPVVSGKEPVNHLGFHGGLRPGEMRVPLVSA